MDGSLFGDWVDFVGVDDLTTGGGGRLYVGRISPRATSISNCSTRSSICC